MKKKLQNFWYYYKVPAIIALIVLAAGIYLFLLQHRSVESDYHAAIVSPQSPSADQLERIQKALEGIGQDQNGDGSVVVTLRVFRFSIGEDGQGMNEAAALDADLVGNQSGLFFVNDPEKFEKSTNGIGKAADAVPVSGIPLFSGCGIDDLYFLVRSGADQRYIEMRSALTEKNIEDKRCASLMRESRIMSRKAGGVWGRSSCPESDRAKLVPCGTGFAPQYPVREGIWTGKEPLLPRLAKHSNTIAKHIIKVSS